MSFERGDIESQKYSIEVVWGLEVRRAAVCAAFESNIDEISSLKAAICR